MNQKVMGYIKHFKVVTADDEGNLEVQVAMTFPYTHPDELAFLAQAKRGGMLTFDMKTAQQAMPLGEMSVNGVRA